MILTCADLVQSKKTLISKMITISCQIVGGGERFKKNRDVIGRKRMGG